MAIRNEKDVNGVSSSIAENLIAAALLSIGHRLRMGTRGTA